MSNFANRTFWGVRTWLGLAIFLALLMLLLTDTRAAKLWLNTAELAAGACLVALPLGSLLAFILFKTDTPGRGPAAWLLVAMLFIPLYLFTGAWDAGFGIQGWHTLVTNPHLAHQPWLAGWRAAVWVHGLAGVPWVVLIVGAGLRAVEPEIEEDAATCAAPINVLWHVTLPRAAPAIGIAAMWISTVVLTEISVTDFFQVRTFAEEIYTQAALGTFDYSTEAVSTQAGRGISTAGAPGASGLWIGMGLSTIIAIALIAAITKHFAELADAPQRAPWIWRLQRARWPAAGLLFLAMALLVGVPLANLAYKAGVHVLASGEGRVRVWSVAKLLERMAAAPGDFRGEIWLSAWLGVAASASALTIALPIAWSLRPILVPKTSNRWAPAGRRFVLVAIALFLTIPGPLLGLAVIRALDRPPSSPLGGLAWLYDSNFAPWLVQVLRSLPVVTLILWPALASVPQAMLDAAATDGTGRWGQLFRIAVPQRWPALAAAGLIGLAIAIGELAATVLVMPPQRGATALSIQVFQLLHYGVDDRVAAICLVMVLTVTTLTGIAATLLQRKQ
jgi:iron(III) transport system permease protein